MPVTFVTMTSASPRWPACRRWSGSSPRTTSSGVAAEQAWHGDRSSAGRAGRRARTVAAHRGVRDPGVAAGVLRAAPQRSHGVAPHESRVADARAARRARRSSTVLGGVVVVCARASSASTRGLGHLGFVAARACWSSSGRRAHGRGVVAAASQADPLCRSVGCARCWRVSSAYDALVDLVVVRPVRCCASDVAPQRGDIVDGLCARRWRQRERSGAAGWCGGRTTATSSATSPPSWSVRSPLPSSWAWSGRGPR